MFPLDHVKIRMLFRAIIKSSEIWSLSSSSIALYRSCLDGWTHGDPLEFKFNHLTLNGPRFYKIVFKKWIAWMCHLKIDPETSVLKPVANYLWELYRIQILHSCLVTLFLLIFNGCDMSDSPRPYELYHTKFLCPPPSSRVCLHSWPLSRW